MKIRNFLSTSATSLAIFVAQPALAEAHAETAPAAELPSGPEGPALWKVSDEDTTIYLFGTIHALPADLEWYDAEIDAALSSSDTVVTEILLDPASQAAMQQLAQQRGIALDGTTLRSRLDADQVVAYEAALEALGIPAAAFDPLKPWLAGLTFGVLPLMQAGYDLEAGVDQVILRKSPDSDKEALETADFQLGIFDGLTTEQQVQFMMHSVNGMGEVTTMVDAMVAEWVEGDADGLAAIMNEGFEEGDDTFATALLYDRNANWAEWIDARLESTPGTVFIAVGAGHLAGSKSVQDYLAAREIEAERVQ